MADIVNATNLANTLKTVYIQGINSCLDNENTLAQDLEDISDSVEFQGSVIKWAIHKGRGAGVRASAAGVQLPDPSHQQIENLEESFGMIVGRVRWEDSFVEQSKKDVGAFTHELQFHMDNLKNDLMHDYGRQVMGDGTGVITLLAAANNVTVTDASPGTFYVDDASKFDIGMNVHITAPTTYLTRMTAGSTVGLRVLDVDDVQNIIYLTRGESNTVCTTGSTAIGDYVCIHGAYETTTPASYELNGIQQIISNSATLHGKNPTTTGNGWWKSIVHDNGGTDTTVSVLMIVRALNRMMRQDAYPKAMYMTYGVQRSLIGMLENKAGYFNQSEIKPGVVVGNYIGPEGPIALKASKWAVKGEIMLPDPNKVGYVKMGKGLKWFGEDINDGNIIHPVANYTQFESTLIGYRQFLTRTRHTHARIQNIIEDEIPTS